MFAPISGNAGIQPINDWFFPDTTQRHPLGFTITAIDPFWGEGRFVYVKSNDVILKGSILVIDEQYTATLLPSATLQGFSWGVAMNMMAAGTYGWMQVEGRAVYATNATVAADGVLAIAAAGILGATATGKQVIGIRNRKAATGTEAILNVNTTSGSATLLCTNGFDGLFLGAAVSGTGIPASSIIVKLMADGKTALMGTTLANPPVANKLATASGSITLTAAYTGLGSGIINNPGCMMAVA
jgi:hypothetical protein